MDPAWTTIPYGYPLVNQTWEVRDRNGDPCPVWVPGELYIGGIGLAQGYWRDPERTALRFRSGPGGVAVDGGDRGLVGRLVAEVEQLRAGLHGLAALSDAEWRRQVDAPVPLKAARRRKNA